MLKKERTVLDKRQTQDEPEEGRQWRSQSKTSLRLESSPIQREKKIPAPHRLPAEQRHPKMSTWAVASSGVTAEVTQNTCEVTADVSPESVQERVTVPLSADAKG
ncbi:hypothetical protein BaRGS_00000328 [Batillaria attramentaria]|uniref:Uncharacterized protein n=1 Tax=Batillaria attramentaria TaxID=370345 RepID=A0ABD0M9F1_9CAEN